MLPVSVVVPVLNASRTLPSCLQALLRLEPTPEEIIVVDNGSTDGSLSILQAFAADHPDRTIHILHETRRGAAAARNTGIRAATGEVIAFTDADCAPEAAWLQFLTVPFEEPTVGAVAGRVVPAPASSPLELFSALYTLRLPDRPSRHRQWTPWEGGFPTANLGVRRSVLDRLAGFDEKLTISGEDHDLCARLYALGCEIVYAPGACVAHHHRTMLRGMLRQAFGFGQAHPNLLRRHTARGLWLDLPRRSIRWARFPARAWVDLASADKKVLAILIAGIVYSPLFLLFPLYAVWLAVGTGRRARQAGVNTSPIAALELAGLLVLKSAALTAGRWYGSVKYGALCL
jgi:GT2 family glycosyltransferase